MCETLCANMKMTTQNENPTLSSNEEPVLKWTAPRAPKSMPRIHRESSIEDLIASLEATQVAEVAQIVSVRTGSTNVRAAYGDLAHVAGSCSSLSLCVQCASLRKTIKMMRKIPACSEDIITRYYMCLGAMSMHDFHARIAQDQLTFNNQDIFMKAQIVRGLAYNKKYLTKDMTMILRSFMVNDRDTTRVVERRSARDFKYQMQHETEFEAQALGPIEHARGDCDETDSMCDDCVSLRKCYVISKRMPDRTAAAYGLVFRILERMSREQAHHFVQMSRWYVSQNTTAACADFLTYHFVYCNPLGGNTTEKLALYEMHKVRQKNLLTRSESDGYVNIEKAWKAQALVGVEFKCSSIDKITDMLQSLITNNNIGVDPSEWARRLTSFVLMILQLCAQSSILIKITAVAQFLTHFHFPGLSSFQGYARQLAQVFQTAVDRIKGRPRMYRDLHTGLNEPEDDYEPIDEENTFRAQGNNDDPVEGGVHEGLLVGTAKLLCAMAGISDYDIKANGKRVARLDQISRTIMSTERLAGFVTKLFKYAYELASVHVFGVKPDMSELQMVSEKIPKWMDEVTSYYANEGMVRVTKHPHEARRVVEWQRQGDEYNSLLWRFKIMPKAYAIFKAVYNQCDKLNQAAAPYVTNSSMRVSPFTMLLYGPPGLGKSTVMYYIITDLMKPLFDARGEVFVPGKEIYLLQSGDKFWDGYHGQRIVNMDDVFQNMDPIATAQQCMDILHMKNVVSWPVQKADLASKGNTFMTAELLMLTGNVAIPNDVSKIVRSYDAIRRRIDIMVFFKLRKQYQDASGRLDRAKVERDYPPEIIDGVQVAADITPIFNFDAYDNQGRMVLQDATYTDMITEVSMRKAQEKGRDEAVIRSNYIRAGLDVHGVERKFESQMWRSAQDTVNKIVYRKEEDDYAGDLIFREDVEHISAMLTGASWERPGSGFLTEEERIEVFATISQTQNPDISWSAKMKRVYASIMDRASTKSLAFSEALGDFVDRIREKMNSSLLTKVGAMVLLAISVISLGWMAHRIMATGEEDDPGYVAETSGDEKTRQTRTILKVDNMTSQGAEVARKIIHGRMFVAVDSTPLKTVWVPESKVPKGKKPLLVNSTLWRDTESELPKDILVKSGEHFIAQACPDRNAYNLGVNRVTNNAVLAKAVHEDRVVAELRGMFVYGRVLMLPMHFFHGLDITHTDVEISNSYGLKQRFNTSECDIKIPPTEMDIIFLRLPKRFQCYVDLRSHFHSDEGLNKYPLREAMLWVIDGENNSKLVTLCDNIQKDTVLDYAITPFNPLEPEKRVHLVKSYVYHGLTLAGYCGAPLIWINPSVQSGHILGIHVAGTNLRGLTTPITRDFLYTFLRDWNDISVRVPNLDPDNGVMTAHSKRAIGKDTPLAHYGRVDARSQVRLPTNTSIVPSPLFGVFEPVTGPALLSPTNEFNPLRTGILKQCVPLVVFPQNVVDEALQHLKNSILSVDSPYRREKHKRMVLTPSEALNGFPGDQWIPPMNLHTSPGYPYINSNTSRNGKFDFVTGEAGERVLHEIVDKRLAERIENGRNRIVDMTIFMDILKDERVKLEKVKTGKTRIFNVAPFDLNIATRMYFQMFAAHLMYDHVYGECAVGLNPHSDEWGMMYYHLKHAGPNWIGGDYSNYDKQLSYQLLKAVLTIIDEFYADENHNVRECLFETMFSAFHIAERDVYRVPQGNPSGIVMTSLINSLVNSLMMRIMYIRLGGSMTTFDQNVRLKTYGDDNIAAVSDEVKWFNMVSISREFAKFGIVYNQPNKEAMHEDMPFLEETQLTFLKRGFRYDAGRVFAPLAMDSIQEMVNWIRESNDNDEATRMNFLAACREVYHHGVQEFARFTTHVYGYAQKHSFRLPYTNYLTSGEFWGTESGGHVNLSAGETTHICDHCYDLEHEEALFSAQSTRAPRKIKAVWPLL